MKSQITKCVIERVYIKMNIHMEWYRIFLRTAELGNLTKAAQQLHITQPSVSYAIKQLEEMMGVKLFHRHSKGVSLTSEGSALLEYVKQAFSLLEAGEKRIQSFVQLASGELRIGASGPVIKHLLLHPLDRFHSAYPGVRIRLVQGRTYEIAKRLKEGKIDIGLVHLPVSDQELDVTHVITNHDCFVVGPAYRALSENPISIQALTKIPLLLLSSGSNTRQFVEQWFEAQGVKAEVDIELNSSDMLIEFAQRGYGAAFVNRSFIQQELEEERLFELKLIEPIPSRHIGIATRRDISLSLAAARFNELLVSSIEHSK